jgi:hypothetical protein
MSAPTQPRRIADQAPAGSKVGGAPALKGMYDAEGVDDANEDPVPPPVKLAPLAYQTHTN